MNLFNMKYITLFGLFTVLNTMCLSAKEINYSNMVDLNIEMSDTLDTNIIVIPNVFSPNGDGLNDLFKVAGNFTKLFVQIYNRYGALIYKSTQLNEGWNGRTTAGIECIEGTYFYIIETDAKTFTGSLTLLR